MARKSMCCAGKETARTVRRGVGVPAASGGWGEVTPASSSAEVPPAHSTSQALLPHSPPRAMPSAHLSPVDGADTRHSVIVTDALGQQPVPDLPGEHGGVLALVVPDLLHHLGGGHLGLRATYHPRPDAASLVVPAPVGTQRPPSRQEALVPAEASGERLGSVPRGWPQTLGGPALSPAWAGLCCCPAGLRCCRPQPGCLVSPLPFPSLPPAVPLYGAYETPSEKGSAYVRAL